ncbi:MULTISPECIES: type IV pilus modification protein PilV [Nitrosomonas]|uniref:Putative pre-pilin leader sequence n=1 Tax=Nitrosomonas europaea (strain ATCC 19718 / CIP 103999 / KCTC 2705 / NBRC 14298) TaxID=228410 RepID=Q82TW9_NITEU|nr:MULTISPECIES: type IV pilus modification protein PilV [Nitrosomonas]CAD85661.1 putative pre-pilin leader sequence [Nitrosomonas europaea ATCC 19718]SDW79701.1 type IV pilus assembly protein PilV [Nitrosomonas europaea]SET34416.1 type IV pilus assembly protein PilV [Nitrosomonas europaea]SJZ90651.1 type IV pilus assembly protein PilV [Nitrosomonas europaea]HBF25854.1 type IV pilus modification protein PilV [Nitrosomonas sp.]
MLNIYRRSAFIYTQAGVSMIEVLVSIIILSIGLLGMAGLQTAGLKSNHSASFRSTASMMAYNILDSMRANRVVAGAGGYNHSLSEEDASETETKVEAEAEIPEDIKNWLKELALRLPEGLGSIDVDADNKVTVLIQWDDSRGAATAQQFVMTTRL